MSDSYGKHEEEDSAVEELKAWIKTQPHLPCIDDMLLRRFLQACKGDIVKAKKLIDLNYAMRNKHGDIFLNRDPCDEEFDRSVQVSELCCVPGVTKDGYKVLCNRLIDYDTQKYNYLELIRTFSMFEDVRLLSSEGNVDVISISDIKGFSLKHFTKTSMSLMRAFSKYNQEAHPILPKAIHMINCPSFFDKVVKAIRPFLKKEVIGLVHFHVPGSETLFDYIPREMLPKEYGGTAGSSVEMNKEWILKVKEKRDYLSDDKYWKIDDTKRPKSKAEFEAREKFKNLDID